MNTIAKIGLFIHCEEVMEHPLFANVLHNGNRKGKWGIHQILIGNIT